MADTSPPSAGRGVRGGRSERRSSIAKKREILQAAARIFREKGLQAAGMRDIAAEAGMQVGNLYYYFENKQELLAFCQLDALSWLLDLAAWVEEQDLDVSGKLYLLVHGHVLRLNEGTPGSLAHLEVEALDAAWRERIQGRRDAYENAYRKLIEDGIAAGLFRPTDVKVAALAILGAVNWTVKWYRPEGGRSAREIGTLFAEQTVRGLLQPGIELEPPPPELLAVGPPDAEPLNASG